MRNTKTNNQGRIKNTKELNYTFKSLYTKLTGTTAQKKAL